MNVTTCSASSTRSEAVPMKTKRQSQIASRQALESASPASAPIVACHPGLSLKLKSIIGQAVADLTKFALDNHIPLTLNAQVLVSMEHSTAILEDAKKTIEGAAQSAPAANTAESSKSRDRRADNEDKGRSNDHGRRNKRKGNFHDSNLQHGSRGGRNNNKRHKKGDLGRAEYLYVHRR